METIQYHTLDKSDWGKGPWQDEPDKVQWQDNATGIPCLAVRNSLGNWCGYVGVSKGHKLYEVEYSSCFQPENHKGEDPDAYISHYEYKCTPESLLDVHGGLTFSGHCHQVDLKTAQRRLAKAREDSKLYPKGDSAHYVKQAALAIEGGPETYKAFCEANYICHTASGEDEVWWFGFDCAHYGDYVPSRYMRLRDCTEEQYRTLSYVQDECAKLAKQLKEQHATPRTLAISGQNSELPDAQEESAGP